MRTIIIYSLPSLTFHSHFPLCFLLVCFVLSQHVSAFPIASISLALSTPWSSVITMWQVEQWTVPRMLKSISSHPWLAAGVSVLNQILALKNKTMAKTKCFFPRNAFLVFLWFFNGIIVFTQVTDTAVFILHSGCTNSKCLFDISFTIYNFSWLGSFKKGL